MKKFSIIMIVYDQARELAENLPAFLQQEYEPGYEVIVGDESSTDDTSDVLKLLKNDHPHLYSTFIPRPNRLISRRKLAFHIGVKAAKNEWIMFTKIEKKPVAKKAPAAEVIIQSPMGGEITPEAVLAKVGTVEKVYIRVDENKAYWVNGEETGSVDLW